MEKALRVLKDRHSDCEMRVVCGFSKLKSIADNIAEVVKNAHRVHFISANHFRALKLNDFLEFYQEELRRIISDYDSIMEHVPAEGNQQTNKQHQWQIEIKQLPRAGAQSDIRARHMTNKILRARH